MFDGKIVKKKFPFKKILDLENFWSKTESKTKLDLGNFHQILDSWSETNLSQISSALFFICLGLFNAYHH